LEDGTLVVEDKRQKEEKQPLVIKPPETNNEHWLQRRLKMFRPDMVDKKPSNADLAGLVPDRIGDGQVKVGLQLTEKRPSPRPEAPMEVDEPQIEKSEDDLARELLIQQAADPNAFNLPKIVIPANPTEEDVYAYDMAHLSDAPTLETYERVPVEAFGMGILLGLGWKEGTDLKGQSAEGFKEPKKRPDFLGIGAKEEEFLRVDAKGQKLSRKEGLGASWNPLKKIDKRTGEVIPDSRRSTPKDRSGVSTPREGSRYATPSRSDYDRDRKDNRSRIDDRRRDEDRRKDSDYDSGRERDRRRDRDYDSERERKYKDRKRDRDGDRRRDNDDRRYDSDYERKRRRDGERSGTTSQRGSRRPSPRSPR